MTAVMDNLANDFSRTVGQGLIAGKVYGIQRGFGRKVLVVGFKFGSETLLAFVQSRWSLESCDSQ